MSSAITRFLLIVALSVLCGAHTWAQRCPTRSWPAAAPRAATPSGVAAASPASAAPASPISGRPTGQQCVAVPSPLSPSSFSAPQRFGQEDAWTEWWDLNKAPLLDLRGQIYANEANTGTADFFLGTGEREQTPVAPTSDARLASAAAPALLAVLETSNQPDVLAGALISAARLTRSSAESLTPQVEALVLRHTTHANIAVREAALVALGIIGGQSNAMLLVEVVRDTAIAHRRLGRTSIPNRVRAFAAYALGLAAHSSKNEDLRRYIQHHLFELLETERWPSPDVPVACVSAIGVATEERENHAPVDSALGTPATHNSAAIARLLAIASSARSDDLVRGHALTAAARIVARLPRRAQDAAREGAVPAVLDLLKHHRRHPPAVLRAAVQALGSLGDNDEDKLDRDIREALLAAPKQFTDRPSRNLAMVSLAQVAGRRGYGENPGAAHAPVQRHLFGQLARGKSHSKPWAALSIGLLADGIRRSGDPPSQAIGATLRAALKTERNPERAGALCTALGLTRDPKALEVLLQVADKTGEAAPHAAVALGMCGNREAIPAIREQIASSKLRPERATSAGLALALLHDSRAVAMVDSLLDDAKTLETQLAAADALGWIGDGGSLESLTELLADQQVASPLRARAAVALGRLVDRSELPWADPYARGSNFLGAPPSFYELDGSGVLNME